VSANAKEIIAVVIFCTTCLLISGLTTVAGMLILMWPG
jgi:hypothetical protein